MNPCAPCGAPATSGSWSPAEMGPQALHGTVPPTSASGGSRARSRKRTRCRRASATRTPRELKRGEGQDETMMRSSPFAWASPGLPGQFQWIPAEGPELRKKNASDSLELLCPQFDVRHFASSELLPVARFFTAASTSVQDSVPPGCRAIVRRNATRAQHGHLLRR